MRTIGKINGAIEKESGDIMLAIGWDKLVAIFDLNSKVIVFEAESHTEAAVVLQCSISSFCCQHDRGT